MADDVPASYPAHLAGDPAPPPEPVAPRLFEMAQRAHERAAEPLSDADLSQLYGATPVRTAGAVDVLFFEADTAAPGRSKRSDGRIGDARHAKLGDDSDHNPWLVHQGRGIVRAGDVTNDPALALHVAFERLRAAAAAGRLPQVLHGGYAILNGRITAPDWSGWRAYLGNPHVSHGHVSVSLNPAQFDSRATWGIFADVAAPATRPAPAGWTGPDLTGAGPGLRGQQGDNGPRVQAWQQWLAANYPAYRHALGDLAPDGWWGPVTTRWNREFGQRSGIPSADGLNIGPKLAAAYHRAGLFRARSAAQARVVGHITRAARR
jgi:hypothetical protein